MLTCVFKYTHTYTHTRINKTFIYTKNIYRDQRSSRTIIFYKTFTDTNPGIKKDHIPSKSLLDKSINQDLT